MNRQVEGNMNMKRYALLVGGVLLIIIALILASSSGAEGKRKKRAVAGSITIVDHNIAGGMSHDGAPSALATVEEKIRNLSPDVVTMQEVCWSQRNAFKESHPGWRVYWAEVRYSHPSCDGNRDPSTVDPESCFEIPCPPNGDELGIMIATPWDTGYSQIMELPHPHMGRRLKLLCVRVSVPGPNVKVCTVHIAAGFAEEVVPGIRNDQIRFVNMTLVNDEEWTGTTTVSGDFNSTPYESRMDRMFQYWDEVMERDTLGDRGMNRIDYIFARKHGTGDAGVSGNRDTTTVSDHPIYWGTVELN